MRNAISDTTTRLRAVYKKNERYFPLASFIAGFLWDSLTLDRIDRLSDNLILLSYIILAGILIIITSLVAEKKIVHPLIIKYQHFLPNALQFFFGGLFSSYVVYYFKSAALTKNWLFLVFLFLLLVSNEFIRDRIKVFYMQIIFYYLALFSFFIFFLPVVFKTISAWLFIGSGLMSSGLTAGMIFFLGKKIDGDYHSRLKPLIKPLLAIFVFFHLIYFTNIIPPVPLSLKYAGTFHSVQKVEDGYRLSYNEPAWYQFFTASDNPFYFTEKDSVYCFSAVFAPTDLKTRIYHHWQWYNPKKEEWQTTDRLSYSIRGGRANGYRGYTYKKNIVAGEWRVDIENDQGQVLGRVSFEAIKEEKATRRRVTQLR